MAISLTQFYITVEGQERKAIKENTHKAHILQLCNVDHPLFQFLRYVVSRTLV